MTVERDWETFTSAGVPGTRFAQVITDEASLAYLDQTETGAAGPGIITVTPLDPPLHTEIRDIATDWFRPAKLNTREDAFRSLAREAIATRLHVGVNEIDLATDFSVHYPLHVVMTLLGLPAEDEPLMMKLTQEFFGPADPDQAREPNEAEGTGPARQAVDATMADIAAYFEAVIDERRTRPRDDLASVIANARDANGEYYDRAYAHGWMLALVTAGHDTTASTLSSTIDALATHPDQLAEIQADLGRVPDLVSEGLRWTSPVKQFVRQATRDVELRGRQIRRGDQLALLYPSANRDEDVFDDPDIFRHDRRPNPHVAFGHGPHMCIGHQLARLELRVILEELLPRIESIEITGERRFVHSNFVGGLKNLPVRLVLR